MNGRPLIVAVVPARNEERTIPRVILLAQKWVDRVIVCDDGSIDMTARIAERMGADVVRHEENRGYGAALQSLFRRAREMGADVTITLDGDGQHDPKEIPALIRPILKDFVDIAVGSRFLEERPSMNMPLYRRLGIKAITRLANITTRNEMSDAQHGFRAYGRKALECLCVSENGMGASVEILMKAKEQGLKVVEVPIGCSYRDLGKTSTQSPLKHGAGLVMSIMKLIIEDRPLLFMGMPGAVSLLTGILFGMWMLQIYAAEHHVVTNIALASIAFILIGFFCLSTAITLYTIKRLAEKINQKE